MKPTDEQIKEFWEKCGWKWLEERHYVHGYMMHGGSYYEGYWMPPDIKNKHESWLRLPDIDLNNLFKYSVPKVRYCDLTKMDKLSCDGDYRASVRCGEGIVGNVGHGDSKDPALALFWAIYSTFDK